MKRRTLTINAERADQQVADGWGFARQQDFTGGESLAKLPLMVTRNQLIRMENAIISPEGEVTECWQMDQALFINVSGGIVVAPIHGSPLFTVYGASGEDVISFTFDPSNPTPYDMANASGYPGYVLKNHIDPVTILGVSHGTPFLGKVYCCASTNLYISGGTGGVVVPPTPGQMTASPSIISFGTCEALTTNRVNVAITNMTANPVTLIALGFSGSGAAVFGHEAVLPQTIAAGATYTFPATFTPPTAAASNAVLTITSNLGYLQMAVNGTAAPAVITAAPASIAFGTVQTLSTTQRDLVITNTTLNPVTLTGASGGGGFGLAFGHTGTFPQTLAPRATYTFAVTFNPPATGASSAALNITSNLGILQVAVSGSAEMKLSCLPAPLTFAQEFGTATAYPVVTNSGSRRVTVTAILFESLSTASIGYGVGTSRSQTDGIYKHSTDAPFYIDPGGILGAGIIPVAVIVAHPPTGPYAYTMNIVTDVGTLTVPITGVGA